MPTKKPYAKGERKARNDLSRNEAKSYMEPWGAEEVEVLESLWSAKTADLEALAALLGRTVEACRQKHYDLAKQPHRVAQESLEKVDKWTKGFTSLEDMGF